VVTFRAEPAGHTTPDAWWRVGRPEVVEPGDGVVLVIDDVHELGSPEVNVDLTPLLTGLPTGTHAILAVRRYLPLRLHRSRLAGELTELRTTELRFSEQETRDLLAASGIAVSEDAVALLYERAEGWAAALRFAAIALTGHPDPERFVADCCVRRSGRAAVSISVRISCVSASGPVMWSQTTSSRWSARTGLLAKTEASRRPLDC
jgi:hypothetical protein